MHAEMILILKFSSIEYQPFEFAVNFLYLIFYAQEDNLIATIYQEVNMI